MLLLPLQAAMDKKTKLLTMDTSAAMLQHQLWQPSKMFEQMVEKSRAGVLFQPCQEKGPCALWNICSKPN